jgi:hypothetical protein
MLSALILGLVVIVVLTFVISGGLFAGVVDRTWGLRELKRLLRPNEERLFALAPDSLSPPAPPVEIQAARKLLPAELPGSYQRGVEAVHLILSVDKMEIVKEMPVSPGRYRIERTVAQPGGLVKEAADLGARCVYWVFYVEGIARDRGFTVVVVDAGDPANAMKLCQTRKRKGATKLAVGREGWTAESPIACGFWAGRYYSELMDEGGRFEGAAGLALLQNAAKALAANQLVYGGPFNQETTTGIAPVETVQQAGPGAGPAPVGVAQFAAVKGGQALPPTKIDRFTDNLYEKIDGKEGMFRAFHFVELRFGQYTNARTQEAHDTYVYDMGEPLNAFGIYMGERSPKAAAWPMGRDGYVSGTNAYFCKDKYYVNVLGPPEGSADSLEVSKAIAAAIAGTIPEGDKPFWVEEYLPAEGRVPNTLKYEATSGLGYEFLQQIFTVRYKAGEKEYQVFLVRTDDASKATALLDKFAEATAKYDKVLSKTSDPAGQQMVGDSMGTFCVAFTKGCFFGGVNECEDQGLAARQAEILKARLPGGEGAAGGASGSTRPAAASAPGEPKEQG